jgi:hypothetical protein
MSTQAFQTRRVSEALGAIERYLDSAVKITESVASSKTLAFELRETPRLAVTPQLDAATWESGHRTITLPSGESHPVITVTGTNLDRVTRLELHGPPPAASVFSAVVVGAGAHGFSAAVPVDLVNADYGDYDVRVVDATGAASVLQDVCAIARPALPAPTIELGAIDPPVINTSPPWKVAVHVLRGDPTSFHVTDLDGNDTGWQVKTMGTSAPGGALHIVSIEITPWAKGAKRTSDALASGADDFCLVAADADTSDRLLLRIERIAGSAS